MRATGMAAPDKEMTKRGKRSPVCTICHKTFKRMEHCLRHELAHKLERPYNCQFCLRSFGRKDLVVRHEKNLHPELWAMLHARNQGARPDRNQQQPLYSPRSALDHQETDHQPLTLNLSGSNPSVNRLGARDSNSGSLPSMPTSFLSQSPLMTTRHMEKDHEHSGNHNDGNSVNQTVYPHPDDPEMVETVNERSSRLPTTKSPVPLASSLSPLSPDISSVEQPQLDVTLHNTSIDDLMTFSLTLGNDNFAADQLFSSSTNANPGFDDMDFDSEGYLPDFEIPPDLWENSMSTKSGPYEPQKSDIHNNSQKSTRMAEGKRSSSSSKNFFKLPRLINDIPPKPRPIYLDQRKRAELVADFARRMMYRYDYEGDIPDCPTLYQFLTRFFESFNTHLPIFHIPTFDLSRNPSPLVLAMCSIGAMYQLERKRASRLRRLASIALDESDSLRQSKEPDTARPAWMVQCKLLLLYGAILGGDAAAASSALEEVGYLHKEFTSRKASLLIDCEKKEVFSLSWQEWIERESSKRMLFGIFILCSLLTITYNISPGLSTGCDLDLELPEEERLWTAPTAESWKDALLSTSSMKRLNTSHVLTQLVYGKGFDTVTETRIGLYAAVVLVHAVNIHAWQVSQSTNSFTNFLTDLDLEDQVARGYLKQVEVVLDRCAQVFARSRCIEDGPPETSESPLPFNGLNLLRSCYARVFCDGGGFSRAVLLSDNDVEKSLAAKSFVLKSEYNMPLMTKIVAFMIEVLRMPSHLGRLVIRKTAALTWSVETAIVLWDCALYSTKWVQMVFRRQNQSGLTPVEQKIMEDIRQFTSISQEEKGGRLSQAAILADTLAAHFDDVWVWQVTFQMGKVLRKLADAYDEHCLQEVGM